MTTDDVPTAAVSSPKRPISRKQRILSQSQSTGKPRSDEFHLNRTLTARSRPPAKLPNLATKASINPTTPEPTRSQRYRSQQRDPSISSSWKFEQRPATMSQTTRFPTLYALINDDEQKQMSELRRRQIYALNHLMRELEQEQFRQYFQSNTVNTDKQEKSDNNNESLV